MDDMRRRFTDHELGAILAIIRRGRGNVKVDGDSARYCPSGTTSVTGFHPPDANFPGVLPPGCVGVPTWLIACSGVELFAVGCRVPAAT